MLLLGQTMAVFDYELAMRLGLQESPEQVGAYGMQVNRAFGAYLLFGIWCLFHLLYRGEALLR